MSDDMRLCYDNVISIPADKFYKSVAYRVAIIMELANSNDNGRMIINNKIKSELDLLLSLVKNDTVLNSDGKVLDQTHCPDFYAKYGILLPSWLAIQLQSNRYWPDDVGVDE